MSYNGIIVTGLYRSGTSFVEKKLDSHADVEVLHQPSFWFFKYLERELWRQGRGLEWPALPAGYELYTDLLDMTLEDITFDAKTTAAIAGNARADAVNHPGVNKTLFPKEAFYDTLAAKLAGERTAAEVFELMLETIHQYRESSASWVGLKEIFLGSLLPLFATRDDTRIITLIRDPREIYFSRNYVADDQTFGTRQRHPVKMIARVWRNHVLMYHYVRNRHDTVLGIRYDDIKDNPDQVIEQLRTFLDIDGSFAKQMTDESGEKQWSINTSDKSGNVGYGKKWHEQMDRDHVAVIEYLCGDLMEALGYTFLLSPEEQRARAVTFEENLEDLKDWTKRRELIYFTS